MSIAQEVPPPAPVAEAPWTADLELERAIRRGMGGQHVRLVQGWLGLDGFHVAVDGEFGPATQRAVREFQRASELPDSGVGWPHELLTAPMMTLVPLLGGTSRRGARRRRGVAPSAARAREIGA
jgi:peptidoglycan hydrolase-like protein with peptidoglycan-binding domain